MSQNGSSMGAVWKAQYLGHHQMPLLLHPDRAAGSPLRGRSKLSQVCSERCHLSPQEEEVLGLHPKA